MTTVEGIGSTKTKLHPVQERIAKAHGSQCGFCTPGIVMSMYTLLRNNPKPSMEDLDTTFQGNLCRCTGYRPILEGFKTFTEDWELQQNRGMSNGNGCAMGDQCCKVNGTSGTNNVLKENDELYDTSTFIPLSTTQEPIFPPELKLNKEYDRQELYFKGKKVEWHRPTKLDNLLELKNKYPDAKIVVGNSEIGVETKFRRIIYPVLIQPIYIPEMTAIVETNTGLKVGSSVTLQQLEKALRTQLKTKDLHKTRIFASIIDMLYYFAGKQIRNVACIGGNIMTSSPISDLVPIFTAANCTVEVTSKRKGLRTLVMNDVFFTGYRKNLIENDEILLSINIPFSETNQYFYAYKQARRRDDDIAIVNAAVNVIFEENGKVIKDIKIAYGGMAPTTVMAKKTQSSLKGKEWNDTTLQLAYQELVNDLPLSPSAPGGNIHYRRSLTLSFFFRAYLAICQQLNINLPDLYNSGITGFKHKVPHSSQYYEIIPETQQKTDFVGRPIPHVAAYKQASGEAIYCDDIPKTDGELYMALVLSTEAYAEIISIDDSEAVAMEGVHAFLSAKDICSRQNHIKPIFQDEEVFISKKVTSKGQVLGIVIAEDQNTAQFAAKKVRVNYNKKSPVIVTLEDAIKHESFFKKTPTTIKRGNVEEAFKTADHIVEGECRTGGQEHFYLETQCVIARPKGEDDELEIVCSTQHPSEISVSYFLNQLQQEEMC